LYRLIVEHRIFSLYRDLKFLEAEWETSAPDTIAGALSERLDQLEERTDHLRVPNAYMHMIYTLKHHISLVRQRLREKKPAQEPLSPGTHKETA